MFGRRALRFERSQLATGLYAESRLLRGKLGGGLTELRLLGAGTDRARTRLLQHLRGLLTESRTLRGSGDVGLRRSLLHACRLQAKPGLLTGHRRLKLPRLRELLCRLLSKPGLLRCDLCRLTTELARGLRTLQRTLLLLLKRSHRLGLRLRVALREKVGDRARLLLHQAALHLGTLHALALATERAGSYGLRRKTLLRDLALAIDLPHRLVDDLLTIRIHEGLRTRRVIALRTATDRTDALLNGLLGSLETRLARGCAGLFGG